MSIQPAPKKSILVLYSHDHSAHMISFKRLLSKIVGLDAHKYLFTFASGRGLERDAWEKLRAKYDSVILTDARISEAYLLEKDAKHDAAAGSLYGNTLVIEDIQHIHTTPTGEFFITRHLEKLFKPEKFVVFPEFTWSRLAEEKDFQYFLSHARTAKLMSCDIETSRNERSITCIGFSILLPTGQILTGVLDQKDDRFFERIRTLLSLPLPKV
jgi:hypothetical protein